MQEEKYKVKEYFARQTVKGKRPPPQKRVKQNQARLDQKLGQYVQRRKQGHVQEDELREKAKNPMEYPYCCIGLLKFKFKENQKQSYYGTGVLIGPNIVLTCAHNCYDQKFQRRVCSMSFFPGLDKQNGVQYKVKDFNYPPEYKEQTKIENDFAILILEEEIETVYGSLGLDFSIEDKSKGKGQLYGYPGQVRSKKTGSKIDVLGHMYGMEGSWEVNGEIISYVITTTGGQSGSPIFICEKGEYYIIGIHTDEGEKKQSPIEQVKNNKGVLLSHRVKEMINSWIPKTLVLDLSQKQKNLQEINAMIRTDRNLKEIFSCENHIGNGGIQDICKTHQKLSKLSISRDCISRLPGEIRNLKYLTTLCIVRNKLTELPKELFNLPFLQILWLSNNEINKLPSNINQLVNLQDLAINRNNLSVLPQQLFMLPKLMALNVCQNQLEELPSKICESKKLIQLNVSHNKLRNLPDKIVGLKLRQFEYDDNQLKLSSEMQKFLTRFV